MSGESRKVEDCASPRICKFCYYLDETSTCVLKGRHKSDIGFCNDFWDKEEGKADEWESGRVG